MAPPGRRKGTFTLFSLFLVVLFLSSTASAASAVLGIDLGTDYLKAAIAKPGSPIEIVLTKDSKRKEAASLAFKPSRQQANDPEAFPERLYGGDALALSARYPGDVYSNLKTLLGLPLDSEIVTEYAERYPGLTIESIPRKDEKGGQGTVGFKSQNAVNTKDAFMVEELLAMELKNIRANAEATVVKGTFVTDAVITFPSYYTAEEKRAIELAADLAGLRVLGLVSDGLAVGINYATNRVFESVTEGAKPEYHLVYDMGAGSTTATVLKFQGRTIKGPAKRNQTIQEVLVLGTGFDRTLGGDSMNAIILEDMVNDIIGQPKVQKLDIDANKLQKHTKSKARLWKEAGRMRQVLSANSAAYASFEGLYDDDLNVKYSLTRDKFEHIAVLHAARVDGPLLQALDQAGITLNELDSIILHGGAVRTPFVGKKLEAVAGGSSKIKANVNADEAAVMGAAFKAAALSPSFRVKDIRTTDISCSTFTLKWSGDGKEKQQKLFVPASQVGVEKQVPISTLEDVTFTFTQTNGEEFAISEIEATNLTKSATQLKDKYGCTPANISTTFTMRLDPYNGLPEIVSGSVSCQAEGSKDGGVFDNVKGLFGFGSKKESDQNPIVDGETEGELETETPLPVSDPTSSGSTISSASPSEEGSSYSETASSSSATTSGKTAKATPSLVSIPISLKKTVVGLNVPPTKVLPRIRQRLTEFDSSDRKNVLRSEALNTLEAFTYRARDHLDDPQFIAVSSDKARAELSKQLSAASEWLYGDGVDAKLQEFKDKLKDLKGLVEPVLNRKEENSKRDEAVKQFREGLQGVDGVIKMVQGNIERAAEAAASSASSLSAAASERTASAASSVPSTTSEGDELEEDPYSATDAAAEPSIVDEEDLFKPYEYSKGDLDALTDAQISAESWLEGKLAAQKKLGPYDDPVILVADLEQRAKQLQTLVSDTVMKSIKMNQPPPKTKSKTSKKPKPKTTSKTSSGGSSSTTTASKSVKDEL